MPPPRPPAPHVPQSLKPVRRLPELALPPGPDTRVPARSGRPALRRCAGSCGSVKCSICWRQETPATAITVSGVGGVDRREEALLADLARDLVVLGLVAERSGHAAAAGAAFGAPATGRLQDRHRRRHADQRLLVAVAVEEHLRALIASVQAMPRSPSPVELGQELVDHEGLARPPLRRRRRPAAGRGTRRAGSGCSSARCR